LGNWTCIVARDAADRRRDLIVMLMALAGWAIEQWPPSH
jgi:hypothetical protein